MRMAVLFCMINSINMEPAKILKLTYNKKLYEYESTFTS